MHDLPRKLTAEELAELFEGRTRLVEKLAEQEDPLGAAREVIAQLSELDKLEALNAHPAIGAKNGRLACSFRIRFRSIRNCLHGSGATRRIRA